MPTPHTMTVYAIEGLWGALVLYWIARAFTNKKTVYRQSRLRQFGNVLAVAIPGMLIDVSPGIHHHFYSLTPITDVAGVTITGVGIALAIYARYILGKNWSGSPTLKQDHQLITRGPYRFVRHPIYTGLVLAIAGTMVAIVPSIAGIAYIVLIATAFAIKLRFEEKLMLRQFPEAYPGYRAKVRTAFIPLIY